MRQEKHLGIEGVLGIAAVVLAVIALFVSWQANVLSREANEIARGANKIAVEGSLPSLGVYERFADDWIFVGIVGCQMLPRVYVTQRSAMDEVTIFNKGGRSAGLLRIVFNDGDMSYSNVQVYDHSIANWEDSKPIALPLTVDAGTASSWYLKAYHVPQEAESYATLEEAQAKLKSLKDTPNYPKWVFTFTDGSTIEKNYTYRTLAVDDSKLEQPCPP